MILCKAYVIPSGLFFGLASRLESFHPFGIEGHQNKLGCSGSSGLRVSHGSGGMFILAAMRR